MPDTKDENAGFLSRVYRFVNSPRTEWGDFDPAQDGGTPASRSDLQLMIEHKRRNDFVRKQEFELLRRVRREGITAAQIRAHAEEGEYAKTVLHGRVDTASPGAMVRTKIDDAERTMVLAPRTTASVRDASATASSPGPAPSMQAAPFTMPVPVGQERAPGRTQRLGEEPTAPHSDLDLGDVTSSQHADPVLEEAAFAFANADFIGCEGSLRQWLAPGADRSHHAPTWLTLLDLYRATGQQQRFEATAADYRREFGLEPGPWESIPRLAAGATSAVVGQGSLARPKDPLHWVCPAFLDGRAIEQLAQWCRSRSRRRHLDWSALQMMDGQAAKALEALMAQWAEASLTWHWSRIERLFDLLEIAAPPDDIGADPTFWRLRLITLRLLGRREDHDLAAREMSALYGIQPAPWQPPRQAVQEGPLPGEAGRSEFMVSTRPDQLGQVQSAQLDLAGQLTGDIAGSLARCDVELGQAQTIFVDCSRLVRVDFIAAGELVNWVAERRARQHMVRFCHPHRLVALFLCAMGLDEHATVEVRGMPAPRGTAS